MLLANVGMYLRVRNTILCVISLLDSRQESVFWQLLHKTDVVFYCYIFHQKGLDHDAAANMNVSKETTESLFRSNLSATQRHVSIPRLLFKTSESPNKGCAVRMQS